MILCVLEQNGLHLCLLPCPRPCVLSNLLTPAVRGILFLTGFIVRLHLWKVVLKCLQCRAMGHSKQNPDLGQVWHEARPHKAVILMGSPGILQLRAAVLSGWGVGPSSLSVVSQGVCYLLLNVYVLNGKGGEGM